MLGIHRRTQPINHPARLERKFYLPPAKISFAAHLLKHCCLSDKHYPQGVVHSVYYDTPDLTCFNDSNDGNYGRHKIRIRWYDTPINNAPTTVYVELKSKNGFAGTKQRKKHTISSWKLERQGIREGIIHYPELQNILMQFGYCTDTCLEPTIYIAYRRLRFEDILTGIRISLDWNIHSTLLAQPWNRWEGQLRLYGGVIEIKGPTSDIPPALQSMRLLETDWSRFSKYAGCMESQFAAPGSAGRFWPSGRIEKH